MLWNNIEFFFHMSGKILDSMQFLYIIDKGLMIAVSHIFIILTDKVSINHIL